MEWSNCGQYLAVVGFIWLPNLQCPMSSIIIIIILCSGLKIEWSNCGQYLAVGGFMRLPNLQCRNELHFYSREGRRIHLVTVPSQVRNPTRSCRSTQFCADGIKTGEKEKKVLVGVGGLVRFSGQASCFALLVSIVSI